MKKRKITNIGLNQPLLDQNGAPLSGVSMEFTLVTENRIPAATVDAVTQEFIVCRKAVAVTTTAQDGDAGEMEIELWPTSRGAEPVFYLCHIPTLGLAFLAPLMDGEEPISWAEFRLSGTLLAASALNNGGFIAHVQDDTRHLSAEQNAALSASSMSAENPVATLADVEFAGGHVHDNKDALDEISEADELPLWKGGPWPGVANSSGHVIVNSLGNAMPQRSKIKFDFEIEGSLFTVTGVDDPANDTTIILVTFPAAISGGTF